MSDPESYCIRFNTCHNGSGLVWRIISGDSEVQVAHLDIRVPVTDATTVENGVTKWNIACTGNLSIVGGTAVIT